MKMIVIAVEKFQTKKGGQIYTCINQGADGHNSVVKLYSKTDSLPLDNKSHTVEAKLPPDVMYFI